MKSKYKGNSFSGWRGGRRRGAGRGFIEMVIGSALLHSFWLLADLLMTDFSPSERAHPFFNPFSIVSLFWHIIQ